MEEFKKQLANPRGLIVKDLIVEPQVGQHVVIRDYSLFEPNKIPQISRMDVVVTEVNPIVLGDNGNYHWNYVITTNADELVDLMPRMYSIKQ